MAQLKPFQGLRFGEKAGEAAALCCPPYDIISERQRKAFLAKNPHNIIRLELPRDGEDPYGTAGETLGRWISDGILKQDENAGFYIYEEEFTAHARRMSVKGLICLVKLEEFEKGVVLPHEETLSKAKTDRLNLMKATGCNFSQIYSLYMDERRETPKLLEPCTKQEPQVSFTDEDGVTHRLWAVTDPEVIETVTKQFEDRKLYIADGHHRYETALNYRSGLLESGKAKPGDGSDYVMMMLCDLQNPGLVVYPTHRVVHSIANFDTAVLLEQCEKNFDVLRDQPLSGLQAQLDTYYKQGKTAFGYYGGGDTCAVLVLKSPRIMETRLKDAGKALRELDVSVLHTLILEDLLGIDKENMAGGKNLRYTRVYQEAVSIGPEVNCSFLLNPTRVDEICAVAAAGEKMPQKSTYFYPKLITGLVMNRAHII